MEPELTTTSRPIDLLLLAIVARKPAHGYALIEQLKLRSGGRFDLPEGTVYPALYRLERLRLLASDTVEVQGRMRRNYRITPAGRAALRKRKAAWKRLAESVSSVLGGGAAPESETAR